LNFCGADLLQRPISEQWIDVFCEPALDGTRVLPTLLDDVSQESTLQAVEPWKLESGFWWFQNLMVLERLTIAQWWPPLGGHIEVLHSRSLQFYLLGRGEVHIVNDSVDIISLVRVEVPFQVELVPKGIRIWRFRVLERNRMNTHVIQMVQLTWLRDAVVIGVDPQ
jgi:hypothetical protein